LQNQHTELEEEDKEEQEEVERAVPPATHIVLCYMLNFQLHQQNLLYHAATK